MNSNRVFWTLLTLAALVPAGRLAAQESADPRWLPWLGCWQPVEDVMAGFGEDAAAPQAYFCVRPGVGGVEIATVVDGAPVSSRSMVADGARHEVSEEGCSGWQSAEWSEDGRRLFVTSETLCEGGVTRTASGLMAMLSPTEWIDAHAVGLGDDRVPRAVRYRPAPTAVAEAAGFDLGTLRFGVVADARRLAAAPLAIEDVAEAAAHVDGMALEAFLFERGQGFDLEADRLAALADQGVSEDVIDLMVALSYPNKFSLDRQGMSGELMPDPDRVTDRYSSGYYGRDRYWDNCYGSAAYYSYCRPYGYMPLGWSYGYYNPYLYGGYGYGGYGYGGTYGRPIIVVDPGDTGPASSGARAVKGQGYTRSRGTASGSSSSAGGSRATGASSVGRSSGSSGGSSAGSAGSAGSSSSGSSSSGRTAKRRGGGGGL